MKRRPPCSETAGNGITEDQTGACQTSESQSDNMKKILFIVNPIAGGKDKKEILGKVLSVLDKNLFSPEIRYTEYAGHACEMARETDADVVVAIGGDGTQNEVARSLVGTGRTMGIIPCGSGDGLALHLGISRKTGKAAEVLNEGEAVFIDNGIVNGHPFFCTTGVGIDAIVSWRFAKAGSRGLKTYIVESVKTWFGFKAENYRITVDGEEKWNGKATLVTIGNANQWGNNARITPLASATDGLLDITIVDEFHTWAFPGLLARLMGGTADRSRHTVCLRGKSIVIEREKEGPLHFDGDPYEMGKRIDISVAEHSLKVLVPKGRACKI